MGRIVLYSNLLCAKSAQVKRLVEQHGVRFTEVPLTGQSFAEQLPRVTGRKSLPLLALNRKEYLTVRTLHRDPVQTLTGAGGGCPRARLARYPREEA